MWFEYMFLFLYRIELLVVYKVLRFKRAFAKRLVWPFKMFWFHVDWRSAWKRLFTLPVGSSVGFGSWMLRELEKEKRNAKKCIRDISHNTSECDGHNSDMPGQQAKERNEYKTERNQVVVDCHRKHIHIHPLHWLTLR